MKRTSIVLLVAAVVMTACATVTITPEGQPKTAADPSFQETQSFFLWGLVPASQTIDVVEICPDGVRQMQAQTTFVNGLLGGLTFGIYSPRTAKVWCEVLSP